MGRNKGSVVAALKALAGTPLTPEEEQLEAEITRLATSKDEFNIGLAMRITQSATTQVYAKLGYTNFGQYCVERHNISKRMGFQYFAVGRWVLNLPDDNARRRAASLGWSKLSLLAKSPVTRMGDAETTRKWLGKAETCNNFTLEAEMKAAGGLPEWQKKAGMGWTLLQIKITKEDAHEIRELIKLGTKAGGHDSKHIAVLEALRAAAPGWKARADVETVASKLLAEPEPVPKTPETIQAKPEPVSAVPEPSAITVGA